jgi:ATPases with chaperone activity, ATP-binding subunit
MPRITDFSGQKNPGNPNGNPNGGNGNGNGGNGNSNSSNNNPNKGNLPPSFPMMPNIGSDDDIESVFINYNEKFKGGSNCLFRDAIEQQMLSVLIGKKKPNALLVGSAGVGKTNIVEHLAYLIANDSTLIPKQLIGSTVYELPLSSVVSGTGIRGQLEQKIENIVKFVENPKNKVILFIDEIHLLYSGGEEYKTVAQFLKPALARGTIRVIGATTLQESQNLLNDPAFSRRFSRLIVDELTREQTIEILKSVQGDLFMHYNNFITVDEETLKTVAIFADEYQTAGSHRPDNAITLLDRSMADALIQFNILCESMKNDPNYNLIKSQTSIALTESQIEKTAMRLMTGNSKKNKLDKEELATELDRIKGQSHAIETITDALIRQDLNLYPKKQPLTFLFAGTSGVGKTEIAKIIAKVLTGVKPIILNMTEYHSSASINRIIGSPAGYVGSDSNQELPFDCLESNPYQVILLDEFEKGNKSVQRLFMSAFEEGFIRTNRGKEIDFSKAIFILTTNAAHKSLSKPLGFAPASTEEPTEKDAANSLLRCALAKF